jgi:hypothetical protein
MTWFLRVTALAALLLIWSLQTSPGAQLGFGGHQPPEALLARPDASGGGWSDARRSARAVPMPRGADRGFAAFASQRASTPASSPLLTPADVPPPYPSTPLYDLDTLRTIFLEFEGADWERALEARYRTGMDVPATMVVDGTTYANVGVRFRGNSSFRRAPSGYKRPLRLSLDFMHDEQHVGGYRTLNLLNGMNDPTFLRTVLFAEIARQYVTVARANLVRVVINGESWGIYTNLQPVNRDFIQERFAVREGERWKATGNLDGRGGLEYLGDDPARYRAFYEIETQDDDQSWAALIELCRVLNETPPEALEAALAPLLDIDGALKFLALDVALVNSDGYWTRASDYNLYRDVNGRFHIIPHDINEALGASGRAGPALDPLVGLTDPRKPLRSKLLAIPALRERYLGYVRDIAETWLDWNRLAPIVTASHRLIADDVRSDTRKLYDTAGFDAAVAATNNPLKSFADRRRAYLLEYTAP